MLDLDVGNGEKLHLLVDSGADISLLKSRRLLGTADFKPRDRVRVKSVEGSIIETHGSTETKILEGSLQILFRFQLVSKRVDLLGDGILGRDFLKQMQAQICYQSRTLTFTNAGVTITKSLSNNSSGNKLTNSGGTSRPDKNTPSVRDYSEVTGRDWVYNCRRIGKTEGTIARGIPSWILSEGSKQVCYYQCIKYH